MNGRGKPPFPTCKLAGVEFYRSAPVNSQVRKGGLPPLISLTLNLTLFCNPVLF
jgi:hypothetical protein